MGIIAGNGPGALSLSAMLSGHAPYYDKARGHPNRALDSLLFANSDTSLFNQVCCRCVLYYIYFVSCYDLNIYICKYLSGLYKLYNVHIIQLICWLLYICKN